MGIFIYARFQYLKKFIEKSMELEFTKILCLLGDR